MSLNNYNTIPQLINLIEENATKLEQGKLSITELDLMLDHSRAIHERIAILRYKALTNTNENLPTTKVEEIKSFTEKSLFNEISTKKEKVNEEVNTGGFSLNFDVSNEEEPEVQTSLLNQIKKDDVAEFSSSINDQLSNQKKESVAEKLQKSKIEDLRKVIGLNQKFLFMNDLFEGEKAHYDFAINHINELSSVSEAKDFLTNDLATKHSWDLNAETTKSFKELVERKFS